MKTKLLSIFFLAMIAMGSNANAQAPVMLKDSVGNGNILDNEAIGNTFYFKLNVTSIRKQLWKTDGTLSGTIMVRDSFYNEIVGLSRINDTLYFIAQTSFSAGAPLGLWKSDGTKAGTTVVKTLSGAGVGFLTVINNVCYFKLGTGIWKTNGTSAGTVLVKSGVSLASGFHKVNNDIVFFAFSATAGYHALWKTDGTGAGTTLLKDSVYRTSLGHSVGSSAIVNGTLYFWVANQNYLWKTDGTVGGTVKMLSVSSAANLTNHNGTLYFTRFNTSPVQWELWSSDGTVPGTLPIPGLTNVYNFTSMGGSLYLSGKASGTDREPYKSDGTAGGTTLLKDIAAGTAESVPNYLTKVNTVVCFQANDGVYGTQIWKTDGTPTGTMMAYTTSDTITALSTVNMIAFNNYLLFIHGGGSYGDLYSIQVDGPTGTNEPINANNGLNIYPNPSSGIVKIEWTGNKSASLQVLNILGEVVVQQSISTEIDLSGQSKGIYFVRITDGEKNYDRKIVIQ